MLGIAGATTTVFDPSALPLTGFWRAFSGGAWNSLASLGVSGSGNNDLVDPGPEPDRGVLNGNSTADFNSTNTNYFESDGTLDTYVNVKAASGWIVMNPSGGAGELWSSTNTPNFFVGRSGSTLFFQIGGTFASKAMAAGAWALATFRYDGVNIQVGVNEVPGASGGGTTAAFSTNIASMTSTLSLGKNVVGSGYYGGRIAEAGISDVVLTDRQFLDVKAYVNGRYGLFL